MVRQAHHPEQRRRVNSNIQCPKRLRFRILVIVIFLEFEFCDLGFMRLHFRKESTITIRIFNLHMGNDPS